MTIGLLIKAKQAGEKTIEDQLKEEIEIAIMEIQIEEREGGKKVTLETLANKQLEEKLEGIEATLENNEITGEYKKYEYKIDHNLKVTIENKVTGISVNYTLSNKEYTKENITLKIMATSTNGEITNIECLDNKLTKNEDETYTITKNGDYTFTITDAIGKTKTKTIKIDKIDKLPPMEFTPEINNITMNSFTINANTEDAEDSIGENAKSGIEKYEYYINGTKYEALETDNTIAELNPNTDYTIYVIAYDKAQNSTKSKEVTIKTKDSIIPLEEILKEGNQYTLKGEQRILSEETIRGVSTFTLSVEIKDFNLFFNNPTTTIFSPIIGVGNTGNFVGDRLCGIFYLGDYVIFYPGCGDQTAIGDFEELDFKEWNKFTMTYDGNSVKCYVNNKLIGSYAGASWKETQLMIGGFANSGITNQWWCLGFVNGIYKNIKFYDYALDDNQISEI